MKYPKIRSQVFRNNLKKIMDQRKMSISRLSEISGVARSTISRMYNDPYVNVTEEVALWLEEALNVEHIDLFSREFFLSVQNDPNGFTDENLLILDSKIKEYKLPQLDYEVYSRNKSMKF